MGNVSPVFFVISTPESPARSPRTKENGSPLFLEGQGTRAALRQSSRNSRSLQGGRQRTPEDGPFVCPNDHRLPRQLPQLGRKQSATSRQRKNHTTSFRSNTVHYNWSTGLHTALATLQLGYLHLPDHQWNEPHYNVVSQLQPVEGSWSSRSPSDTICIFNFQSKCQNMMSR